MPGQTNNYGYRYLKLGDQLNPTWDEQNMQTVENQIAALVNFVQPGVYQGWDVTSMSLGQNTVSDAEIIAERVALIQGYDSCPYCTLGENYQALGLKPSLHLQDVNAATTANVTLSGLQTIDGVSLTAGQRVLVKNQTDATTNGVYIVSSSAWTRSTDLNNTNQLQAGLVVRVLGGNVNYYVIFTLAYQSSYSLGTTVLHWINVWDQTIRVTSGSGIVGLFTAQTTSTFYFRYSATGIYYVWVEPGNCLVSEGLALITAPLDGNYNHNQSTTATYLATIEVAIDSTTTDPIVYSITYEDIRNDLKDLSGAALTVERLYFYRHVHLGGEGHPSKIQLSVNLVLTGIGPVGSTILILTDPTGANFNGAPSNYGFPKVLLNNVPLVDTAYDLVPGTPWKIYLKNSIAPGSVLQVILPLWSQVNLFLNPDSGSLINSPLIYLTDGTTTTDSNGNTVDVTYTWTPEFYDIPDVYLTTNGGVKSLISDSLYTINPGQGTIAFNPLLQRDESANPDPTKYNDNSLSVILTKLGKQIIGLLSGKRVSNLDASTFVYGKIAPNRIEGLDHVGQVRNQDLASLKPYLRLFDGGDHQTYYPEVVSSSLQLNTQVHCIFYSANVSPGAILLGTKRGLMVTSDYITASLQSSWITDSGEPKKIIDEILPGAGNHYNRTYIETIEGQIFCSSNLGTSWFNVPLPTFSLTVGSRTAVATSFDVHSQKVQVASGVLGILEDKWSTILYAGTEQDGVFIQQVQDGETLSIDSTATVLYDSFGAPIAPGKVYCVKAIILPSTSTDADTGVVTVTYNPYVLVGCDAGFFVNFHQFSTDIVKGVMWIQNGTVNQNLNDIVWWTDHAVYITHSAAQDDDGQGNTSWVGPLRHLTNSYTAVVAATNANISLSGLQTVDGISLSTGNRVLVKNQTTSSQNGIYVVSSGTWTRAADMAASSTLTRDSSIAITGGTINAGSIWMVPHLPVSTVVGTDEINFRPYFWKVIENDSIIFQNVKQRVQTSQYFTLANSGFGLITDTFTDGTPPSFSTLPWDAEQSDARDLVSLSSSTDNNGLLYVASTRGIWKSATTLYDISPEDPWTRTIFQFNEFGATPTLYDEKTLDIESGWNVNYDFQSFTFESEQTNFLNMVYERDYTDYYVAPWISTNADVLVYINGSLSTIPFTTNSSTGNIHFVQGLNNDDVVTVTIIRTGAYLSNVGVNPHLEIPKSAFVIGTTQIASLSKALAPTDQVMVVNNPFAIDPLAQFVTLTSGTTSENVPIVVSIQGNARIITIPYARSTTNTFDVGTAIYSCTVETVYGIEDIITQVQTNQTYNFNSLSGVNTIQLTTAAKSQYPQLFTQFFADSPTADRGPKNALFFNFATDTLDTRGTSSSLFIGISPSIYDTPVAPQTIYAIENASSSGVGMEIGTEQGIWFYSSGNWLKDSPLGTSARVYFLRSITDNIGKINPTYDTAGTDTGLWQKIDGVWQQNSLFPQAVFDHWSGTWGDDGNGNATSNVTAWAKNDGLAFVESTIGSDTFTSDHFDAIDGLNVYGLYKDKFIRITTDSSGNTTNNNVDALYLCTESGLYGVCSGSRTGTYASLLAGREMFGSNPLTVPYTTPYGDNVLVPVKFYTIFKSPRPNSIPLIILTNNGIYRVRNWRWCDPDVNVGQPPILDFSPEVHALNGISCYCNVSIYSAATDSSPEVNKCFVGTSAGVYRSYDEGTTWTVCERINGQLTPVYALSLYGTTLLAGTATGFWESSDDGDTWNRPSGFNFNVTTGLPFGDNQNIYAQTFTPDGYNTIVKVSVYVSRDPDTGNVYYSDALSTNYLSASIFTTNSDGSPASAISLGSPPLGVVVPDQIQVSQINEPGFVTIYIPVTLPDTTSTYALVVSETRSNSSYPYLLRWETSTLTNAYSNGKAWIKDGTAAWAALSNGEDFYFKIFFQTPSVPTLTTVNADFTQGCEHGAIRNDYANLTMDPKFAMVLLIDDSQSTSWTFPTPDEIKTSSEVNSLVNNFWSRTGSPSYSTSYGDVWVYGTNLLDRTLGFTNNLSAINTAINALYERGTISDLLEAAQLAISGLTPQSIADSILLPASSDANIETNLTNVQNLVNYLQDKHILDLTDITNFYNSQPESLQSGWPGSAETIQLYDDVSTYLVQRWTQSFTPLCLLFVDGDNNADGDPAQVALAANAMFDNLGVPIYSFGLGISNKQDQLRTMTAQTGGRHFDIYVGTDTSDWTQAINSLLHGGDNNVFKSYWSQKYDYDTPVYVNVVFATFSIEFANIVEATCLVQVRYTRNRIDFTPWSTLSSNFGLVINDLVLGLELQVIMTEGYHFDGTNYITVQPVITSLYHIEVTPSFNFLVTEPYAINGMIFEELLSAAVDLPTTARANWAIGRGYSADFADFEPIINNRNGALPNRQASVLYTNEIIRSKLTTQGQSPDSNGYYSIYLIFDTDTKVATFLPSDVLTVYVDGIVANPSSYSADGNSGLLYFNTSFPPTTIILVTITTPQHLYNSVGEPASTRDYRTYYAVNGPWPSDATAVVLVNGNIVRGGYYSSYADGTVTFSQERNKMDVITIFIQHQEVFRVGVELLSYTNNPVTPSNFGLFYSVLPESNVLQEAGTTDAPYLVGGVSINPINGTIYDRLTVQYNFASKQNNQESGTIIHWFKNGTEVTGYLNRTVEKESDQGVGGLFAPGDTVYVTVTPSDGFSYGTTITSPTYTLRGNHPPYITNPYVGTLTNPPIAGDPLEAIYSFVDPDSVANQDDFSTVIWYEKDGSTPVVDSTGNPYGKFIPAGVTIAGQAYDFIVTPYDGEDYGIPLSSNTVIVH